MWGIPGAILAVPVLAITKIICNEIPALRAVLDSSNLFACYRKTPLPYTVHARMGASTMTSPSHNDADVAALRTEIAALKRGVMSLLEHLNGGATNGTQSAAEQDDDRAHRIYRSAAAEVEQATKAINRHVEEQPLIALLFALGIGYVGGRLLSR